ncbi:MAG TPA: hypothetical protein VNE21_02785 [Mycobacteriales bacterium]|nr:hypothetical protein [Mycobacteriales bacterium]
MTRSIVLRGGVGAVALALAVTACGGSTKPAASSTPSPSAATTSSTTTTADTTNTVAAQLYAGLDQLLRQHVDLTANVVQTAITKGVGSNNTKLALEALDQNTQGLGAAIGSVYGAAAQQAFLKMWRAHIGFFVNYTIGVATKNASMVTTAQTDLKGYISQFSTFVAGATKLPAAAVAADLQGHVTTLETAINAIVAKSSDAGTDISMAAMHMDGTAQVLAQGIVSSKGLTGAVAGAGSALRAGLTGLLIQHVAATGFVVETAVANGGNLTVPEVKGAIAALSANTDSLGAAIGSVYGAAAQQAFLTMWRAHIGFFVNYTLGVATKNASMVSTAQNDLKGYISQFSTFIAGATKLPAAAVAADLQGHVSTLETAINDIVAGSPAASADLSMAEAHMAGTAAVLAKGIASSAPAKFSS